MCFTDGSLFGIPARCRLTLTLTLQLLPAKKSAGFVNHFKLRHCNPSAPPQLDTLADMCERPMDKDGLAQCPFCLKEDQHIRSHVAHHMSTLGLAARRRYRDGQEWKGQGRGHKADNADNSMSSRASTSLSNASGENSKMVETRSRHQRRTSKLSDRELYAAATTRCTKQLFRSS